MKHLLWVSLLPSDVQLILSQVPYDLPLREYF